MVKSFFFQEKTKDIKIKCKNKSCQRYWLQIVIEANADVLENEVGDNKWLTYIQNETDSMDKLINELLLLAKMENVDDIKSYEIFDVSNQIEMCASVFESMAYEKK